MKLSFATQHCQTLIHTASYGWKRSRIILMLLGQIMQKTYISRKHIGRKDLTIKSEEQALFFSEKDGQLIGMTGIYRSLSKKSLHSAMIWGVYVRPQWRGRHISEKLVRACLKWAKDQGLAIVKLAVVTTNQSAIHCYERCGFTIYGTEPKAINYDGAYYDEYLMAIEVDSI